VTTIDKKAISAEVRRLLQAEATGQPPLPREFAALDLLNHLAEQSRLRRDLVERLVRVGVVLRVRHSEPDVFE
jgi:hypothetical protein